MISTSQKLFILTDTGPLVALISRNDKNHARSLEALKSLPKTPLTTIWPCFTEAMYLLGRDGGFAAQSELLGFLKAGVLRIWNPNPEQALILEQRIGEIMATYRELPCDMADAAIVAVAELENTNRIFTLDRHFYAYRMSDGSAFELLPP